MYITSCPLGPSQLFNSIVDATNPIIDTVQFVSMQIFRVLQGLFFSAKTSSFSRGFSEVIKLSNSSLAFRLFVSLGGVFAFNHIDALRHSIENGYVANIEKLFNQDSSLVNQSFSSKKHLYICPLTWIAMQESLPNQLESFQMISSIYKKENRTSIKRVANVHPATYALRAGHYDIALLLIKDHIEYLNNMPQPQNRDEQETYSQCVQNLFDVLKDCIFHASRDKKYLFFNEVLESTQELIKANKDISWIGDCLIAEAVRMNDLYIFETLKELGLTFSLAVLEPKFRGRLQAIHFNKLGWGRYGEYMDDVFGRAVIEYLTNADVPSDMIGAILENVADKSCPLIGYVVECFFQISTNHYSRYSERSSIEEIYSKFLDLLDLLIKEGYDVNASVLFEPCSYWDFFLDDSPTPLWQIMLNFQNIKSRSSEFLPTMDLTVEKLIKAGAETQFLAKKDLFLSSETVNLNLIEVFNEADLPALMTILKHTSSFSIDDLMRTIKTVVEKFYYRECMGCSELLEALLQKGNIHPDTVIIEEWNSNLLMAMLQVQEGLHPDFFQNRLRCVTVLIDHGATLPEINGLLNVQKKLLLQALHVLKKEKEAFILAMESKKAPAYLFFSNDELFERNLVSKGSEESPSIFDYLRFGNTTFDVEQVIASLEESII